MPRLNKVIELLEQGKVVFGGAVVTPGELESTMAFADLSYDFVIFEMEHLGFDFPNLRLSLQFLLNRRRIANRASLQPDVMPFVRVPPNAREFNQWVIKQTLDTGVYGLILPHLDTVEQARAAVIACRYPQATGAADYEPPGQRGWAPLVAPRLLGPERTRVHRACRFVAARSARRDVFHAAHRRCRGRAKPARHSEGG